MKKIIAKMKRNKISVFIIFFFIVYIVFSVCFFKYAFYQRDLISVEYEKAMQLFEEGNYEDALEIFSTLQNYKDVEEYILESKYNLAIESFKKQEYNIAEKMFTELGDYKDSIVYLAQINIENLEELQKAVYEKASLYFECENYEDAFSLLNSILDYKDAKTLAEECEVQIMRRNLNNIVAAGVRTSVAITDKGTVVAVGDNDDERCKVDGWKNIVSVDTYGCFTVGLTENGQVELAGVYDGEEVDVSEWNDIIDIAAGERFIVGLKLGGTVVAAGHNADKQIDIETWKNIVAIDAGWSFTVSLTENKELLFAGIDNGQQKEFERNKDKWIDVVNISAGGGGIGYRGGGHTVGLKSDGTVVAVGDNEYGQCEVSGWTDIVKVVAGDWYTVGLKEDGTILITGENGKGYKYIEYDVLEICTDIVDIAAGYGHTLCLHEDGTVTAFGFDVDGKCSDTIEWDNLMVPEIKKR